MRNVCGTALLLLFLPVSAATQEMPTIKVDVKVVNVLASVRDKNGRIVNTLEKEDFSLEEDGRPQVIKYFGRETDLPLTLGLLVDTSLSQIRVLDEEKEASAVFVTDVLRADKDSAFLIHFDFDVGLLQDVTTSPTKMEAALQKLGAPHRNTDYGRSRTGGGTLFFDSVFLASDELMQKQQGRKALVILSDGVDQGSKMTIDRAIEAAQRANTVVYTILFSDSQAYGGGRWDRGGRPRIGIGGGPWGGGWPGGGGSRGDNRQRRPRPDGKKALERIARETGGRMFEVSEKLSISKIYRDIQDELRNQYNIGYSSDQPSTTNQYRRIKLTTHNKGFSVQAREGYYAASASEQASR